MENASKALLMAGAMLIGAMILSLAVYLYSVFGGTSSKINDSLFEKDLNKLNIQFTKYEGKEEIRAQDIITICNLIKDAKKVYDYDISLTLIGTTGYTNQNDILNNYDSFLKTYSLKSDGISPQYFKCKYGDIGYNNLSRVVNSITIRIIE